MSGGGRRSAEEKMPQVLPMKVDGAVVRGVYQKISTEGDAYRFVTAEAGVAQIIYKNDPVRVTAGSGGAVTWRDFVLDAPYLVGVNQLEVFLLSNTNGLMNRIPNKLSLDQGRAAQGTNWPSGLLDPATASICSFEELTYNTVRVYNMPAAGFDTVLFSIPHTSLPGALRERVQIKRQGDRVAIELLGDGDGIVLRSEGGKKGILRVDDELNLGIDPA